MGSTHRPGSSTSLDYSLPSSQPSNNVSSIDSYRNTFGHRRTESLTRRGHSDGNILTESSGSARRFHRTPNAHEPPWADSTARPSEAQYQEVDLTELAARRRAMMAEDKRRHFSDAREGRDRRMSSTSFLGHRGPHTSFGHPHSPRSRASSGPLGTRNLPLPSGILNRPLPRRPSVDSISDGRAREIKLPTWQPDEDISKCPICGTSFTFWYRKHHCRKCGRVVCANCSPHRITIPRQFIVHPPDITPASPNGPTSGGVEIVDLTDDGSIESGTRERPRTSEYKIDPALGGGQEVRLCNPCVPDPNPLPHIPDSSPRSLPLEAQSRRRPNPLVDGRAIEEGSFSWGSSHASSAALTSPFTSTRPSTDSVRNHEIGTLPSPHSLPYATRHRHSHSFRPTSNAMSPPAMPTVFGSAPSQADERRHLEDLAYNRRPPHLNHRHRASMGGPPPTTSRTFHMPEFQPPSSRRTTAPQLKEEDECPICHGELPPKGPGGSEMAREAHVTACIESHFSTSTTPTVSRPRPSVATDAAVAASAATPSQASGRRFLGSTAQENTSVIERAQSSFSRNRRRTTGMVVYNATEKDCVGENGDGEAECVICFEEFAVGEEMGRLECLCKFHRKCIRQWWDTKGPGACPVHQQAI